MVRSIHQKTHDKLCLFAGYDSNGVIEPYVIRYLKELSKYTDIYYLADSPMNEGELDKIEPYVKLALAEKHGAYDFGSYSLLACKVVGWDIISTYDELIFANDSSYCIKSLETMFKTMNERDCDFWGVQATKGMGVSQKPIAFSSKNHSEKMPISLINSMNSEFEKDSFYDFHVGSYFIAFRKRIINDPDFRLAVSSVKQEENKADIVTKYEIGWSHLLLKKNYKVSTYLPFVYPFHPLFTEWYFESLKDGMPFLKRFLLTKNHYYIPDLYKWNEILADYTTQECIDEIELNINKNSDSKFLHYIHHIKT